VEVEESLVTLLHITRGGHLHRDGLRRVAQLEPGQMDLEEAGSTAFFPATSGV